MFRKHAAKTIIAALAIQAGIHDAVMAGAVKPSFSCEATGAGRSRQCRSNATAYLLPVRDTRAAAASGGGANSCWSACFNDYNQCMDAIPKDVCVSRMKTCLAVCDHLSNRPGM